MVRLAIVGAGIGGCAAAYFARKYIPNSEITIFEAEKRLGGRILTQNEDGVNLELGATFFNSINRTIWDIVKDENLSIKEIKERKNFAIWNGSEIVFKSNKHFFFTALQLPAKYSLSMAKMSFLLKEAENRVRKLYKEETENLGEIAELFKSASLDTYYKKTFEEILTERGISRDFIYDIITPITRSIYSQNADLGALAGLSAIIGVYRGPVYSLTEGNKTLPTRLTQASNATLNIDQKVKHIEKTSQDSYVVSTERNNSIFDGVIIAAPFGLSDIELEGVSTTKPAYQPNQEVYVKVMRGILDLTYFSLKESLEIPAIVLTTKEADPITHFRIHKLAEGKALLAVASTSPISDDKIEGMFKHAGTKVVEHHWKAAYPVFVPIENLPVTQLDNNLMLLNSLEPAVSSVETQALAAKHAAKIMSVELS